MSTASNIVDSSFIDQVKRIRNRQSLKFITLSELQEIEFMQQFWGRDWRMKITCPELVKNYELEVERQRLQFDETDY